jgi:hypothetical protein
MGWQATVGQPGALRQPPLVAKQTGKCRTRRHNGDSI